jgi:predicted MPP superfamily phosphohydrolase
MEIQKITRRGFLKFSGSAVFGCVVAGLGAWQYAHRVEPAWIEINELDLTLPRLAASFDGLRLVQISDIHIGNWMNASRLARVVEQTLALRPDVIAITGDFLVGHGWDDRHRTLLDQLAEGLRPLAQACPVFAVLGNHDHWSRPAEVRAMLKRCDITDLSNTVRCITRGSDALFFAGVDSSFVHQDNLDLVLEQLPDGAETVLLAHEPDFADRSAPTGRFSLQISGHSHGGQVVLPFIGAPVLPYLGEKYPAGLYRVGEMTQYTNRGVGMASLGIRFNCRPEITAFTLHAPHSSRPVEA